MTDSTGAPARAARQPREYYTLSNENNYTIWSFLKECFVRVLIYKRYGVMTWYPRCATGISNKALST